MKKYRIVYINKTYSPNSIVLIEDGDTKIGIIENVSDDKLSILLLDRIGRIIIDKNNVELLETTDAQSLRDHYNHYINKDVNDLIKSSYKQFVEKIEEKTI